MLNSCVFSKILPVFCCSATHIFRGIKSSTTQVSGKLGTVSPEMSHKANSFATNLCPFDLKQSILVK